jgi:hypothetical protein
MIRGIHLFEVDSTGLCPHCRIGVKFVPASRYNWHGAGEGNVGTSAVATGEQESIEIDSSLCPQCHKPIVVLKSIKVRQGKILEERTVYPMNVARILPSEVPNSIGCDFNEASAVLSISQKASAALSRRCLQNILADNGFTKRDLNDQITDALPKLPTRIAENLDAVRNIGNFAAHPLKHQSTGLIVDVEPEEANWNLDVLEELFDFYYVQPKRAEEKRKKLNEKLKDLGKPSIKKPT